MMRRKFTIGYTNPGYPAVRTILNKCSECDYVRSRSFVSLVEKIFSHVPVCTQFGAAFCGGTRLGQIDLMHFFNVIDMPPCRMPYVTTFETMLPRFPKTEGWWWMKGLESLASSSCRRILALSECNAAMQRRLFASLGLDEISKKILVLSPPQDVLQTSSTKPRRSNAPLRFLFVGRDFFHKGGGEIVRVFARIRKEFPIELVCIGDYNRHDYMACQSRDASAAIAKLIGENRDWISYYPSLPNAQVLELMRTCDVGLLPTRADTYGYSVLEMQACGLPCITTNVRALPEINSIDCGWMIPVSKEESGESLHRNQEQLENLSEEIERGLEKSIRTIFNEGRESLEKRGLASLARIKDCHDPAVYGQKMMQVYMEAME